MLRKRIGHDTILADIVGADKTIRSFARTSTEGSVAFARTFGARSTASHLLKCVRRDWTQSKRFTGHICQQLTPHDNLQRKT
jgi:hypothetical protein